MCRSMSLSSLIMELRISLHQSVYTNIKHSVCRYRRRLCITRFIHLTVLYYLYKCFWRVEMECRTCLQRERERDDRFVFNTFNVRSLNLSWTSYILCLFSNITKKVIQINCEQNEGWSMNTRILCIEDRSLLRVRWRGN